MRYKIFIANKERTTVLQLPILPAELPKINTSSNNETFETFNNGSFNIIGNVNLVETSFEFKLPGKGKNYPYQQIRDINPDNYIILLNEAMVYKKPIALIVSRNDGSYYINGLFSVESFEWNENKVSDYVVNISLKQWRDY